MNFMVSPVRMGEVISTDSVCQGGLNLLGKLFTVVVVVGAWVWFTLFAIRKPLGNRPYQSLKSKPVLTMGFDASSVIPDTCEIVFRQF